MTARTTAPRATALAAAPAPPPHWAAIDPATGRILSVGGPGLASLPAQVRASLNMQQIPQDLALAFHKDSNDRTFIGGVLGRTTPLPLRLATEAVTKRAAILAATDYIMMSDAPLAVAKIAAWKVYRQALRDITAQPGYPQTIVWPTPPST